MGPVLHPHPATVRPAAPRAGERCTAHHGAAMGCGSCWRVCGLQRGVGSGRKAEARSCHDQSLHQPQRRQRSCHPCAHHHDGCGMKVADWYRVRCRLRLHRLVRRPRRFRCRCHYQGCCRCCPAPPQGRTIPPRRSLQSWLSHQLQPSPFSQPAPRHLDAQRGHA